jgi:hypothetical protein
MGGIGVVLACGVLFGSCAGVKSFNRYQKVADNKTNRQVIRANAKNAVLVNETKIKQTHQLIQVEKQKADIRVQEAKGIASAQHIINATLTPLYLQHEAVKAQLEMAKGTNHTVVYVPAGANGVPLVQTVEK